jgi:hypothetical protein
MSTVGTKVRVATAASAIAAAATLTPAAIAHATATPPGVGNTLGTATVTCQPGVPGSCVTPAVATPAANSAANGPLFWFGSPGNPNYQPLLGITFFTGPNTPDFEACFLGFGARSGPYNTTFVGFSNGC